ncbi:hypothetical protein ARALYDRAFT_901696 [Arabidopsis lyrata subsp. lyrata]|uniref:Uncharacterized protein n=1 Tax=Arabidopsis lyrata subsp. lyrata TaxID=81972 RepID=D7LIE0_ARALL|nr:hypothetical protein ARALYDRAFT_901696 [Arabidopsis lyrata subsp. lyrata]
MARRRRTLFSNFSSVSLLSDFSACFQDRFPRFDPKIAQIWRFGLAGFVFVVSLPPSEPDVFPVFPRSAFRQLCILSLLSCLTRNHRPFCGPSSTFVIASPPPAPVKKAELISIKFTVLGRPRETNLQNLKKDMARSPYELSNTTSEQAITSLPIWRTYPPPCPMRGRVENGETLLASMVSSLVLGPSHFGPFVFQLRPIMISFGPPLLPAWPRSITSMLLLSRNVKRCDRFMKPIDQGNQLNHNPPLLLCWYKNYLRTLPLESPRIIIHIVKSLKKNGIMIPSLRSGGYRNFLNFSSMIHLLNDFIQELIRNIMDITLESRSLKKIGIMIPSPRSGDYQSFIIPLYPFLLNFEPMPTRRNLYLPGYSTIGPNVLIAFRAGEP